MNYPKSKKETTMKKKGTVKLYKIFPITSLSYKLEQKESIRKSINSKITTTFLSTPIRIYLWYSLANRFEINWLFPVILPLETILAIAKVMQIIEDEKKLKEIKKEIAKHLNEVEPEVISNKEDQEQLIKRI